MSSADQEVIMARFLKYFSITVFLSLILHSPVGVQANPPQPFEVQSLRVEKNSDTCQTTLFVTIKNNSPSASDSGLFVHAAQFRDMGNGQQMSSLISSVRLDNLPAGQSREVSYHFIRQRQMNGASFRFKVGAGTIAYTEKSLPPVIEQYSGKINNQVFDPVDNKLKGSVTNQGNVAIPKPAIQIYIASSATPNDYQPGGGGQVTECLAPGATMSFTRPMQPMAADSAIKINLLSDGMVLDEKILGNISAMKTKTIIKLAPATRPKYKTK
jgi:hypothetical protein